MKIKYVKGNLLEAPEKFILHGCNMQGRYGSGVAKQIKAKYPSAFTAYKLAIDGGMALGTVSWAEQEDGKLIMNGLTQQYYGRKAGEVYVSYEALRSVMINVCWFANMHRLHNKIPEEYIMAVAMPKIGAGLGGGDWNIISEIIEEESLFFQPVVYEL